MVDESSCEDLAITSDVMPSLGPSFHNSRSFGVSLTARVVSNLLGPGCR